jgi:hypothetical protein
MATVSSCQCTIVGSWLWRRPGCGRSGPARVSRGGRGSDECLALSGTTSISFLIADPCRPPRPSFSCAVIRWSLGCCVVDTSSETGGRSCPDGSMQADPSRRLVCRDGDLWREEPSHDGRMAPWTLSRSLEKGRVCSRGPSSRMERSRTKSNNQPGAQGAMVKSTRAEKGLSRPLGYFEPGDSEVGWRLSVR